MTLGKLAASSHSGFGLSAVIDYFRGAAAWIMLVLTDTVTSFANPVFGIGSYLTLKPSVGASQNAVSIDGTCLTEPGAGNNLTGSVMGVRGVVDHEGDGQLSTATDPASGVFGHVVYGAAGTMAFGVGAFGQATNNANGVLSTAVGVLAGIEQIGTGGTIQVGGHQ